MLAWCLKNWKYGIPLLLIPLVLALRGFGWLGGLFKWPPSTSGNRPIIRDCEAERERIIDHRESEDERIITEADRERRDIDGWIDEGLNK